MMPLYTRPLRCGPSDRDRFLNELLRRVDIDRTTGCWIKKNRKRSSNYQQISIFGLRGSAHRVAYAIYYGSCSADGVIDHICNHRDCLNPEHLCETTHSGNIKASVSRGRHGSKTRPESIPRGECRANSAFHDSDIRSIWCRLDSGESRQAIAIEYGVSQWAIHRLAWRHSYRHLLSKEESLKWPPRNKPTVKTPSKTSFWGVPREKDRTRFAARLVTLRNGCQVLRMASDKSPIPIRGACSFRVGMRDMRCYQAAWILHHGSLPSSGHVIRHTCNQGHKNCCNIDHLKSGTKTDNAVDTVKSGNHVSTKLSQEDVRNIFTQYANGGYSSSQLADLYGVGYLAIWRIIIRQTHKHVRVREAIVTLAQTKLRHRNRSHKLRKEHQHGAPLFIQQSFNF